MGNNQLTGLILSTPSGMRDILPKETYIRDWVSDKILKVYQKYNFERIETPILENIQNLKRQDGGENLSLIFEVLKRGDKLDEVLKTQAFSKDDLIDYGLRFDLTVPLVRYFVNNQANLTNPFKSIQIGPVFRAERPQKGRFRQFTQCDIDIIGVKNESCEIELIDATAKALVAIGFKDFTVVINDRRLITNLLKSLNLPDNEMAKVFIIIDKIDKIGQSGMEAEIDASFDHSIAQKLKLTLDNLLQISQSNNTDVIKNFKDLKSILPGIDLNEIENILGAMNKVINICKALSSDLYNFKFDPTLARGMGYYTGMIFEIKAGGVNYSLAGGGRYDNMIGKISNRPTPACGFSIGFERVVGLLLDQNLTENITSSDKLALIYNSDKDDLASVINLMASFQNLGYNVSIMTRKKDITKQLNQLVENRFTKYCIYNKDNESNKIKDFFDR